MRLIQAFVIIFILALCGFYLLETNEIPLHKTVHHSHHSQQKQSKLKAKSIPKVKKDRSSDKKDLVDWIGQSSDELTDNLGKPKRIDKSAYGYDWWIYKDGEQLYKQFGVKDGKVKTIYATGKNIKAQSLQIGNPYDKLADRYHFKKDITFKDGLSSYTFHLKDDDVKMRPLVNISDDVYLQLYFDTFENKLSSIRILSADTLLKQRPYKVEYRGSLPDKPDLSKKTWKTVESGMEKQIFDITNVMRKQFAKPKLKQNKEVADVAFGHSKDMSKNHYFSHESQNGDGLKERLFTKKVSYTKAGENIAAQYTDAPAAMEGWLNSKGHRDALLKRDYTDLGVGVYHFYYTQNFIEKP